MKYKEPKQEWGALNALDVEPPTPKAVAEHKLRAQRNNAAFAAILFAGSTLAMCALYFFAPMSTCPALDAAVGDCPELYADCQQKLGVCLEGFPVCEGISSTRQYDPELLLCYEVCRRERSGENL